MERMLLYVYVYVYVYVSEARDYPRKRMYIRIIPSLRASHTHDQHVVFKQLRITSEYLYIWMHACSQSMGTPIGVGLANGPQACRTPYQKPM
jgi:hypothetical protein